MNFNKNEFDLFRKDIKEAVKEVEKKFGVEITFGKISYDESHFTIKTEVANGSKEEGKRKEFEKYCTLYGLDKNDFGREFLYQGELCRFVGLEMNRRKYPIIIESVVTGKQILITEPGIKKLLGKEVK